MQIAPPDFVKKSAINGNIDAKRNFVFDVCQHKIAEIKYQMPEELAY